MALVGEDVMALEIGESIRLAPPVWRDLVDWCGALGVRVVSLPIDAEPGEIDAAREALGGARDIAVFACPDPSTRVAHDVVVSVLGTSAAAGVDVLLDKGATRTLCDEVGAMAPLGLAGSGPGVQDEAAGLLAQVGRVVVKDPTGYAGQGITVVDTQDALGAALGQLPSVVVEEFVDGQEFSVEAVCSPGSVDVFGWLAKGSTTSPVHPLLRLRYAPPGPVPVILRTAVERLLRASPYRGIVEVELVVRRGVPYVLECNPRTSGVTASMFFTGRASSMRRHVADLVGTTTTSGAATPVVDFQLFDVTREPCSDDVAVYVQRPPIHTEFEVRAYLAGDDTDIESALTAFDPALGAQFEERLVATAQLEAGLGTGASTSVTAHG